MSKWTWMAGIGVACWGSVALAANCATVSFSQVSTIGNWNPINPAQQVQSFTATITRAANSTKTARLILLDSSSASPLRLAAAGPLYSVTAGGTNIAFPSTASVSTATNPLINLGNGNSQTVTLTFVVPANSAGTDWTSGASFVENLGYAIQCFQANGRSAGIDGPFNAGGPTLRLTVPSLVTASLAQPAVLDFGNFTSSSMALQFNIRSTGNISAVVTNPGFMSIGGATAPPDNSKISYAMTIGGQPVAAPGGNLNLPRGTVAGSLYPVQLTLTGGGSSGKIPGAYSSTIVVTLSPGN